MSFGTHEVIIMKRIKVSNGYQSFWVTNPKKIKFYEELQDHARMTITILKKVK